jgi:hypothetical protein
MADWEERFGSYVERLGDVLGHADRRQPLRAYCTGLLLPGERKSLEPMAARVEPFRVGAAHQSLHHFVAKAAWDDDALLAAVRDYVLCRRSRSVGRSGPGSSTTPACRRRAGSRPGWRGSTAASAASGTTARSR